MKHVIKFSGHENIRSLHTKTIEITCDQHLTIFGDCIVGVSAESGCSNLPQSLKDLLRSDRAITFTLRVGEYDFVINGYGSPDLTLDHTEDIVLRKSKFICPRTIAICCDQTADKIPEEMIKLLQDPNTIGELIIKV